MIKVSKEAVKSFWKGVGYAFLGCFCILMLGLALVSCSDATVKQPTRTVKIEGVSDDMVHIMAQSYVKKVLKAPASAKFPSFDYELSKLGKDDYRVISHVDAQNGFGANLRNTYSVTLTYLGGNWALEKNWTLHELIFDGDEIFENRTLKVYE